MAFRNNDKVSSINRSWSLFCVSAISAPNAQNLGLTKCPLNRQSYALHQMGDRFWRIVSGSRIYEIVKGIRTWFVGTLFYISIRDRIMRLQQRSTTRTFYRSSQTVKNMPELTTLRCDKLMMLALRGFERPCAWSEAECGRR
jgi:hypothetical protein